MKDYNKNVEGQLVRIADLIEKHVTNYSALSDTIGVQLLNEVEQLKIKIGQKLDKSSERVGRLNELVNGPLPHTRKDEAALIAERASFSTLVFIQVEVNDLYNDLKSQLNANHFPNIQNTK